MKNLSILILLLFPVLVVAQELNQKTTDPKKNNEMLIGYCNRNGFAKINSNFDSAFMAEYPLYQPEGAILNLLKENIKGIKITLVMATWCGDSKEWVPRFFKILDGLNFNFRNLSLICVDRDKKAPGTNVESLGIKLVPTFVFYKKKAELGRIVEVPNGLLEKNMLEILAKPAK